MGTGSSAIPRAEMPTLVVRSVGGPEARGESAEEQAADHGGASSDGQKYSDGPRGDVLLGTEGGQIREADVDCGEHDAADHEGRHQPATSQQFADRTRGPRRSRSWSNAREGRKAERKDEEDAHARWPR